MANDFGYKTGKAVKDLEFEAYYSWDSSVIKVDGKYHMFTSRWDRRYGFGWNWLFHSEIVHSVSDSPEGPYKFQTKAPIPTTILNNSITQYCSRPQKIMFILQKSEGEGTYKELFYEIKKDLIQTEKESFSDELKALIAI